MQLGGALAGRLPDYFSKQHPVLWNVVLKALTASPARRPTGESLENLVLTWIDQFAHVARFGHGCCIQRVLYFNVLQEILCRHSESIANRKT